LYLPKLYEQFFGGPFPPLWGGKPDQCLFLDITPLPSKGGHSLFSSPLCVLGKKELVVPVVFLTVCLFPYYTSIIQKRMSSQVRWHMSVLPVLRRLRQENHEFKASLDYNSKTLSQKANNKKT
jgi:hypothetical protein